MNLIQVLQSNKHYLKQKKIVLRNKMTSQQDRRNRKEKSDSMRATYQRIS